MTKNTAREAAAEFLGTALLLTFGLGAVAQSVLSSQSHGEVLSINLAWGLAVMLAVYVAAGVSGAHLNPAITLALAVHRGFAWRKVGPYLAAQFVGAFAGAGLVYLTYREALDQFDGGVRQIVGPQASAGIFATYPQAFLSVFPGGFIDQTVGTALLVIVVFALSDRRNSAPGTTLAPVLVGATVALIGMTFGFNAGYAINPARDLAPRIFTAVAGWGIGVFTESGHWWWVPIVAPCLGALLGGGIYDFFIARRHPVLGSVEA